MTHHKKRRIRLRSLYQWHRYLGITAALFVIILSMTGLLLNHTTQLQLDARYVQNDWLLDHYGIRAPAGVPAFLAGGHWASQWGERLFLDERDLGTTTQRLIGSVAYGGMILLALDGEVWLLTPDGEVVERLGGADGVPAGLSAIGITDDGKLAVTAAHGIYTADEDLVIWQDDPDAITVWSHPRPLPAPRHQRLLRLYRGKGLSLERVLLDVHSGRIGGTAGVVVMDVAAGLLLFLASSGVWIWLRNRSRRKQRGRRHP
ncbi:MAG TPA: PepSY domain-containing protein [Chromatiales bacterium]|nr:PepSY domain-containing protein [Chromatiales bacterium]